MPTYVFLCKFTQQGLKSVRTGEGPARARRAIEQLGGRAIGSYVTMGRYDVVWVVELPDEQAAASFALGAGMAGNLTTETLRAFSPDEVREIVANLPT